MRARPLAVFIAIAATLVAWLSVRMWFGDEHRVWQISSLLGSFAPLGAAFIFLYVRAVGGREDSVLAAWLVRAIGMHCVLLWMIGTGDWLRVATGFNPDSGAPLMLLGFAPVFGLSLGILAWIRSVAHRLDGDAIDPLTASVSASFERVPPYRGVVMTSESAPVARPAFTPLLAGSLGAVALLSGARPTLCLGLAPLALALFAVPGWRAVGPSVLSLAALSAIALARAPFVSADAAWRAGMHWPWLTVVVVAIYLTAVEARLRLSPVAARA